METYRPKNKTPSKIIAAFLAASLIFGGCTSPISKVPEKPENQDANIFVHDFGVVRPQSEQIHLFELKNSGEAERNVRKIVQNCSCTVAKPSSLSIPPGGTLNVELIYRAGKDFSDDVRDSVVYFEQEEIEPVILRVKARIRPQVTLQPSLFSLSSYMPNDRQTDRFTLQDWSDTGLKEVEFISEEPWISVSSPKKGKNNDARTPFPPWEGSFTVDTTNLNSGRHQGRIRVLARDGETEYVSSMTVVLVVASAVKVIPSNLFFGEIRPGETASLECTMLLVPQKNSDTHEDLWKLMKVESDFPEHVLEATIRKVSDTKGTLTVRLTPHHLGRLKGNIRIVFQDARFHDLTLPVIAHVVDDDSSSSLPSRKSHENDQ